MQLLLYSGVNYHEVNNNPSYEYGPSSLLSVAIEALTADKPYDYALYAVNSVHSNAFEAWLARGRPPLSALSATDLEALRAAGELAVLETQEALCTTTFEKTVELASPGVLLLTLTPTGS